MFLATIIAKNVIICYVDKSLHKQKVKLLAKNIERFFLYGWWVENKTKEKKNTFYKIFDNLALCENENTRTNTISLRFQCSSFNMNSRFLDTSIVRVLDVAPRTFYQLAYQPLSITFKDDYVTFPYNSDFQLKKDESDWQSTTTWGLPTKRIILQHFNKTYTRSHTE